MKKQILKNITTYNKFLIIFKIIAACYKDDNRLEEIKYMENKLLEILKDESKYQEGYQYNDYRWLNNKIINDCHTFYEVYQNVEEYIDNRCRMVSVMTLNHLSENELKVFGSNVLNYIKDYDDIDDACNNAYLESQIELNSFITLILDYYDLEKNRPLNKQTALDYVKDNRYYIGKSINIWVDVFNQLKILMRNLPNYNDAGYKVIQEKYFILLKYYFVIVTSPKFSS